MLTLVQLQQRMLQLQALCTLASVMHLWYVNRPDLCTLACVKDELPMCRYKVEYYMDSWMGYIADRNRFLAAVANATNPVVYGGDTHNYWGG